NCLLRLGETARYADLVELRISALHEQVRPFVKLVVGFFNQADSEDTWMNRLAGAPVVALVGIGAASAGRVAAPASGKAKAVARNRLTHRRSRSVEDCGCATSTPVYRPLDRPNLIETGSHR